MAELRFLPWDEPLLPAAAATLVREFSLDQVLDLGETLLVLPGSRAGRRLLEILVDQATQRGLLLVPPRRMITVGSLAEELYFPALPLASGAEARRAWARALERVPATLIQSVFGEGGNQEDQGTVLSLAHLLHSLNHAVGSGGWTFQDVALECGKGLLHSDEERWAALARIQKEALAALRGAGRLDREEARRKAARDGPPEFSGRVILVGVVEMPTGVRKIVERASERVLALIHAPEEMAEGFDPLGTLRKEWWQDRAVPLEDAQLAVRDRPGDQAEEVVRFLGFLGGTYGPEEITLGVSDRSLVPYLTQSLDAHGLPHRYAEGSPVAHSPPVQLLKAVMAYLESPRFGAFANLLRHPDLPSALDPEGAPELADAYFREHLPAKLPDGPLLEGGPRRDLSALRATLHGPGLLGVLQGRRSLREWAPRILGFLGEIYGAQAIRRDRPHDRLVLEGCVLLRDAAESLLRLPPALDGTFTASEAIRILLGEIQEGRIPPPGEEAALELVGWLELHLDDAPVLVLAGVNDPFLPEAINADPFLPNALRTRLGLEDNQARFARDSYRLTAILHSRTHLRLIAGRRSGDGDPLRPSRLLLTGKADQVARRVLLFTGGDDSGPTPPFLAPQELAAGRGSGFRLPLLERIPLPELPQPFPVTAFRSLLEDPFAWVLEQAIGLEECPDDLQEMDPLGFGSLAHAVLEGWARSPEAGSSDPREIRERLSRTLDLLAKERFGSHPLPTVPIQVEQLRARLGEFAQWQAQWASEGWRIYAAEARTPAGGTSFDVDEVPLRLSGRVDRIDRNEVTGGWMVLDYKTGEGGADTSESRTRDGRWKDLQLPLYRYLLGDLRKADGTSLGLPGREMPADVGLAYLPLSKNTGPVEPSVAPWAQAEIEEAWEAAREVIRVLRTAGEVVFDPRRTGRRAPGPFGALLGQGILQDEGGEA